MASSIDLTSAASSSSVDDWGPSTKSNSVDLTAMPSPPRRRHEVISVGSDVTSPQREPTWIVVPSDSDDDDNDVKVAMTPKAHVKVSDAAPRPRPAKRTKNHLATSKKPRTAIPLPPAVATKYVWDDGRSRKVPQGWTFPDMTIAKLWMCWFHGSPEEGIGPFRELTQDDFESTTCVSYVRCWEVASVVMSAFLTIAVSNDLIDENKVAATPPATLARQFLAVFERIYPDEDPQTKLMSSCLSPSEWPQDDADVAIAPLVFPRGLTCVEMWRQWFHGTPTPLRQLQPSDFDSPDCKSHWSNAKQFIAHVATTAKSLDLVATKKAIALLDKNALDRVMDAAFTVLASKQEHALTTTQNTKHSVVDEALVAWLNNQAAAATPPPSDLPPLDSLVGSFPIKKLWRLWFHGDSLTRGTPYRRRRWVKDEATKAVLRELTKVAVKSRHLSEVPSIVSLERTSGAHLSTVLAQVLKELRAVFPVDERPFMQPDTTVTRLWSVLFNLPMPDPQPEGATSDHPKPTIVPAPSLVNSEIPRDMPKLSTNDPSPVLVFPRGLTCQEMWLRWFHGTPTPLRQLQPSHFDSPDCKCHWSIAKQFIQRLTTTAKLLDLVPTEKAMDGLDVVALDRVMDAAFTALVLLQKDQGTPQNTKHSVVDETLVAFLNQAAATTPPPSDLPPLDSLVGGFPIKQLWHLWFHGDSLTRGTPYRRRRWVKDEATKAVLHELTKVAVKSRHLPEVPSIVSLERTSSAQLSTVLAQVLKELRAVFPVDERPFMQPDTTVTRLWSVLFNLPMPEGVCDREKGKTTKVVAKFPSLSLRAMWVLWWKGDEDGGYRHREWTKGSAEALRKTKHVMEELGRCAAELNVSADELDAMDRDALQKLLPTLFDNLKGRITNARLRDMNLDNTCDAVYKGVVNVRRGRPPKLGR
ncbi:hypothetical protein DYB37_009668 [Aphanomyces astaci]|uniref:Uncharacterized protein n=1 Tax=Aphanomyces astaci TaxID=112090 RepID=A0A3R6YLD6_APHAT|nr:hypothetical protein DYB37_009668 [Aphanomyces astaci]